MLLLSFLLLLIILLQLRRWPSWQLSQINYSTTHKHMLVSPRLLLHSPFLLFRIYWQMFQHLYWLHLHPLLHLRHRIPRGKWFIVTMRKPVYRLRMRLILRMKRKKMKVLIRMTNHENIPKRNRTITLPEQQDYLMSKYSIESNSSRKMFEEISAEVKFKKRVVQLWFQNTRARERKGNIIKPDSNSIPINKKCLHCSLIFKSKFTLENHLLTKHSDLYQSKDQFNSLDLDLFPTTTTTNVHPNEDL